LDERKFLVRIMLRYSGFGLAIVLLASAVFMLLAPRFGWRVDAVFSGSMEPELKLGSLVVTRPVTAVSIRVGDIITFYSPLNAKITSHRVTSVQDGPPLYFRTAGDANEAPDPFAVPARNVVGIVSLDAPYLGYLTQFIKTPRGILLTLFVPGLFVIALELRSIWSTLSREEVERKSG
jgi:signal peptidase